MCAYRKKSFLIPNRMMCVPAHRTGQDRAFSLPFAGRLASLSSGELAIAAEKEDRRRVPLTPVGDSRVLACVGVPGNEPFDLDGERGGGGRAPSPAAASVRRNSTHNRENDYTTSKYMHVDHLLIVYDSPRFRRSSAAPRACWPGMMLRTCHPRVRSRTEVVHRHYAAAQPFPCRRPTTGGWSLVRIASQTALNLREEW